MTALLPIRSRRPRLNINVHSRLRSTIGEPSRLNSPIGKPPRPSLLDLLRQGRVTLRPITPNRHLSPTALSSMLALDRAVRSQREYTPDGHLRIASTVLTRAEPSPYRGGEIPDFEMHGLDPERTYWLLRDPSELKKALKTFDSLPLLADHRPLSSVDHPYELVVGATGTDAKFNGSDLTNSLVIWAEPAIRAVESGERRDLSCGYRYVPVISSGRWKGKRIDGYMTGIIAQHCALVPKGRVSGAYVADALPQQWQQQRQWN